MLAVEKAILILDNYYKYPKMYASTKEAFLACVSSVIMMLSDSPLEFDASSFYSKHLQVDAENAAYYNLPNLLSWSDYHSSFDNEWARKVVKHAKVLCGI